MSERRQYTIRTNSVREQVYAILRSEIVNIELKPGTVISTQETAERLNVSRTPVREAFIMLNTESLLDLTPQKATVVSKIDYNRVKQEWFIREALEVQNMRAFALLVTEENIAEMEANLWEQKLCAEQNDYIKMMRLDNRFHSLEFVDTQQSLAGELLSQKNGHYDRLRLLTSQTEGRIKGIVGEHEAMLQAIKKRDAELAVTLLKQHISKVENYSMAACKRWPEYFV